MSQVPKSLQAVLWSTDLDKLDLKRDKQYIIHQVLTYGPDSDIQWLMETYSRRNVIDVFVHNPSKIYPRERYLFVKDFLLKLKNVHLEKDLYITSINGPVKQRATSEYKLKYNQAALIEIPSHLI